MNEQPISTAEKRAKSVYEWVDSAVVSLIVVAVVFCCFVRIVGVDGESMQYTLMHQDRLLLNCNYTSVERGDIVAISRDYGEPLIKRVIAVGGDTIAVENGQVILNGEVLDEPYIDTDTPPFEMQGEVRVPKDTVFVIGDNRYNSHDSRWNDIGCVNIDDVIGTAFWRIFPLTSFGEIA